MTDAPSAPSGRFVVLRHETPPDHARPLHWDFMLEMEGTLWTWALERPPAAGATVVARLLPNHRLEYLEYEGEISGERGRVSRWDAGEFRLIGRRANRIVVELRGGKLDRLRAELVQRDAPQEWIASFDYA